MTLDHLLKFALDFFPIINLNPVLMKQNPFLPHHVLMIMKEENFLCSHWVFSVNWCLYIYFIIICIKYLFAVKYNKVEIAHVYTLSFDINTYLTIEVYRSILNINGWHNVMWGLTNINLESFNLSEQCVRNWRIKTHNIKLGNTLWKFIIRGSQSGNTKCI